MSEQIQTAIIAEMERRAASGAIEAQLSPDERARIIAKNTPLTQRIKAALFGASAQLATAPPAGAIEGADFSHWNGVVDFDRLPVQYKLIITKATEGTWFTDDKMERNVTEAQRTERDAGVYHFGRPDAPAPGQVDYFLGQTTSLRIDPAGWYALDFEITGGLDGRSLNSWLWVFCDRLIERVRRMRLYTNLATMSKLTGDVSWLARMPVELWVASWGSVTPSLPAPFTDWVIWQDGILPKGSVPGVVSGMDHNWAKVTIGAPDPDPDPEPPPPDPDPEPTPEGGPLFRALAAPWLNLRDAPRLSGTRVGEIAFGSIVEALDVSGPAEVWLKVRTPDGQVGWAAFKYNGNQLMERVDE